MPNKTLEVTCYVAGAGAFGVFLRWLQDQLAFNDAGLANKSAFHAFVVLYILAIAFVFLRFIDRERGARSTVPEDFELALKNPGKLYAALRWAAGGIICLGSLLLFASSETDDQVELLRVLAAFSFVFGLSYPALLAQANRPMQRQGLWCLAACEPVVLFALWLIISYKTNDINSVRWAYIIEMTALILAMAAFFRLAGFVFDSANGWRSMFFSMMAAALCIMTLADERYMGMQLILLGTAALLLLCNWLLFTNVQKGKPQPKEEPNDGFERL